MRIESAVISSPGEIHCGRQYRDDCAAVVMSIAYAVLREGDHMDDIVLHGVGTIVSGACLEVSYRDGVCDPRYCFQVPLNLLNCRRLAPSALCCPAASRSTVGCRSQEIGFCAYWRQFCPSRKLHAPSGHPAGASACLRFIRAWELRVVLPHSLDFRVTWEACLK